MTEIAARQPETPRLKSLRRSLGSNSEGLTIKPLIISAPFGNYIQPIGATATLGTFTALRRPGRFWQVLRTVRYYPRIGAWVNQIGLRNPGIEWLAQQAGAGRINTADKIISIHGFNGAEWRTLLQHASQLKPLAIELNMSCPNVGHINGPPDLFERAAAVGTKVIVKLPPVRFQEMARHALDAGLRTFHCCNTLPVPRGGVSGKPLKPVALQCIGDLRAIARTLNIEPELSIIGGGGITTKGDIDDYINAGAHHVAIATKAMNPLLFLTSKPLRPLIDHAFARLSRS